MTDHPGPPVGAEREHLRDGFGFTLKTERLTAGYTQQQLADHAGLSERAVQHLEAGTRRPRSDTVRVLAYVLRRPQPRTEDDRKKLERSPSMVVDRETGPAEDLAAQLCALAGDSLPHPQKVHRGRRDLIEHIAKFGLTRAERFQEGERLLQDTLATADLDTIAAIEAAAIRRGVSPDRLDLIAAAKERAIEEGRWGPRTALGHVRAMRSTTTRSVRART